MADRNKTGRPRRQGKDKNGQQAHAGERSVRTVPHSRQPGERTQRADRNQKQHNDRNPKHESSNARAKALCGIYKKCGGCSYLHLPYEEQLREKENYVRRLMNGIAKVAPAIGMEDPWHYRNKVSAAFARRRDGRIVSGIYEEGTHNVLPVTSCRIENEKADEIIGTIRNLIPSFKIRIYNEDTRAGLLRHVVVRTGHSTGQILVTMVAASPVFPSRNNFVKALVKAHPEITSIVLNINDRATSMVLGQRNIVLYGKGYIEDVLCGKTFRISPTSFYQVNSVQTEILYREAIRRAQLTGREKVIDAYCGIGTIGIIAADQAGEVIGVEQNRAAAKDALTNARRNGVKNIRFANADATEFLVRMAAEGEKADVIFMDPPRAGSTPAFIRAAASVGPSRIVYISCEPETLARDLREFKSCGYRPGTVQPVDMFPWAGAVENLCVLSRE